MSSIMISEIMERNIMNMCSEYVGVVVRHLGTKYSFNAEEALRDIDMPTLKKGTNTVTAPRRKEKEINEKSKKNEPHIVPAIPLPFCGEIKSEWCQAIVKNNKLFTQCTNIKASDNTYCKKCSKICQKEGDIPFGDIQSRIQTPPMEFKDPKGVAVVHYSVVMKKMNITRENAQAEATKFGWKIDENQFNIPEKSRGRPKKTEETSEDDKKNGKRGRPKKDKPVKASSQVGDDIIAGLLAQANANKEEENNDTQETMTPPPLDTKKQLKEIKQNKKNIKKNNEKKTEIINEIIISKELSSDDISSSDEEEEDTKDDDDKVPEIKVKKFEFKGKIYLRSEPDNILYDAKTQEPIGTFNTKNNCIEPISEQESEEEEEEN
jgi:hypothetical protein